MNKKFNTSKEQLQDLYRDFSSLNIAKLLNLHPTTIQYWLHKYNIPIKESSSYKRTLGYKHTKETKQKMRRARLGIKYSQETKNKMGKTMRDTKCHAKERNGRWIDGRTSLRNCIRHLDEYKNWIIQVFKRDNYLCQYCFKKSNKKEAHHLIRFNWILTNFLKRYSQFSPIKDKHSLLELIKNDEDMFDVSNGLTLCRDCHDMTKHRFIKE